VITGKLRLRACDMHRKYEADVKHVTCELGLYTRTCRSFSPTGERAGWNCNV